MKYGLILAMVCVASVCYAQDSSLQNMENKAKQALAKSELPVSAQPAEREYNAAVEAAQKEYDAKVKKATEAFVVKLDAAMKEETKKGNLDGALAIKNKTQEIKPQESKQEVVSSSPLSKAIVGQWFESPSNIILEIKIDGEVYEGSSVVAKWNENKDTIVVTWNSGWIGVFRAKKLANKGIEFEGEFKQPNGQAAGKRTWTKVTK